jgi:hypothetical protein
MPTFNAAPTILVLGLIIELLAVVVDGAQKSMPVGEAA